MEDRKPCTNPRLPTAGTAVQLLEWKVRLQCTGPTGMFVGKPSIDQTGHTCSAISISIVK